MQTLMEKIDERTDQGEIFELDSTVNLVIFENSKLKVLNTLKNHGAAIRALKDGKLGQAIVSDFRYPDKIAGEVRKLAELGDKVPFEFSPPAEIPDIKLQDRSVSSMEVKDMIDDGNHAVEIIKEYDNDISVEYIAERSKERVRVLTSKGFDGNYERLFYSYGLSTELVEEQNIFRVGKYAKGISRPKRAPEIARELLDYIKVGRHTVSFKPGKMPVLFAPSALSDVLMSFTGAVDGDLVAKGVSPLSKKLGEQILDPRITILDDPLHYDGIMSSKFDDEGTPTKRKAVIEKGVLKNFLANRKAAARLNMEPTGNGLRAVPFEKYKSFTEGVSTDFSNLIMQGGERSEEKIRKDIKRGIEIHQINGILLGDLIGGDFSGSLEVAFLIENGERVGRVKNAMVAGNFYKLFKDQLIDLSAEQSWTGIFGGCSGSLSLPWTLIDSVEVSGTD